MTAQEEYMDKLRAQAKKAGKPLGPQAQAALRRPANYTELSPRQQWSVDDDLGILDWDGLWNT